MTNDYLSKKVYQRKGTSVVIAETDANKKDPNLVPMTVAEAIKLGYMEDPKPDPSLNNAESSLQKENERLNHQLTQLSSQFSEVAAELKTLKTEKQDMQDAQENGVAPILPDPAVTGVDLGQPDSMVTVETTVPESTGHDDTEDQLTELIGNVG